MPTEPKSQITATDQEPEGSSPLRWFSLETEVAPAVSAGSFTVTPVAKRLTVRFGLGGFAYAWPHKVIISEAGRSSHVRIPNRTRSIQAAIALATGLIAYGLLRKSTLRKERKK